MGKVIYRRPIPPGSIVGVDGQILSATDFGGIATPKTRHLVSAEMVSASGLTATTGAASGITTLATINWTNGTGTSEFAWTDGVPARNVICDPATQINPTVRAAADEGWTGPGNVFRCQNTTAGCGGLLLQDLMPLPSNGDVWVLRWSYKQSEDQIYDHAHTIVGFSPSQPGDGKLILNATTLGGAGTWNHALKGFPANFSWNARNAGNTDYLLFTNTEWHRFEVAIQWSTQDASFIYYRIYIRVYNAAGTLVATEANYRSYWIDSEAVDESLPSFYDAGNYLQYPIDGLTNSVQALNVRDFWLGISRSYATDQGNSFWAGVDVGTADTVTFYGAY